MRVIGFLREGNSMNGKMKRALPGYELKVKVSINNDLPPTLNKGANWVKLGLERRS
jgi:hypothetical protein